MLKLAITTSKPTRVDLDNYGQLGLVTMLVMATMRQPDSYGYMPNY